MKHYRNILILLIIILSCTSCASYNAHQAAYPYNSHARRVTLVHERSHYRGYRKPVKEKPPKHYIAKSQAGKKKRRR